MNIEKAEKWATEVIHGFPAFLDAMKDKDIPGRFRYSESGDIYTGTKWGLGNTVFAVKCCYMLNKMEIIKKEDAIKYIKSFQKPNGNIFDPLIISKSKFERLRIALESFRPMDYFSYVPMSIRAQTRQSFAALEMLDSKPDFPYGEIPGNIENIKKYINSLNWRQPWGAASHVNHLAFFLKENRRHFNLYENYQELLEVLFETLNTYRQEDGSWGIGSLSSQQKINGAMKAILAYNTLDKNDFGMKNELIDLCLSAANKEHACNNFNIICVLYNATRDVTEYRKDEIVGYILKRMELYKKFYKSSGGFSFRENKANKIYYGAKITAGRNEADIHASHLFLWGITLMSNMLGIALNLRLPVT